MGVVAEEQTQKEIRTGDFAGFEDGERDQDAWNVGGLKKLEKVRKCILLYRPKKRMQFC